MQQISQSNNGHFFVLLAAMLWGTSGTAQSLAPEGAQPEVIGAVRLAISGLVLFLIATLFKKQAIIKKWPLFSTTCAVISVASLQICFFGALPKIGVAIGTAIFIGSFPVFTGLLSFFIFRKHPEPRWFVATILAILGCFLLLDFSDSHSTDFIGGLLALGAGASYAVFTLSIQSMLKDNSSVAVTAIVFILGSILLSPALFGPSLSWLTEFKGIVVSLYLGIIATVIPYLLFAHGLRSISAPTAATLNIAEPLTATILGIVILHEHLSLNATLGLVFLISGIFIITVNFNRKKAID